MQIILRIKLNKINNLKPDKWSYNNEVVIQEGWALSYEE